MIAGREHESPDLTDVNTFATVLIRGFDCEGNLINDRGSGAATYTSHNRRGHVAAVQGVTGPGAPQRLRHS